MKNKRLQEAVLAGIINQGQADLLDDFLAEKVAVIPPPVDDEEPIDVARGFGEVFLTIGVISLLTGVVVLSRDLTFFIMPFLSWGIAEGLRGWKQTRLPMMTLLLAFVLSIAWFVQGITAGTLQDVDVDGLGETAMIVSALAAILAAAGFYIRFRTPFAWLVMAASFCTLLMAVGARISGAGSFEGLSFLISLGISAIIVMAIAIIFDTRDPLRQKRSSQSAFWLHIAAGPMVVHATLGLLAHFISSPAFVAGVSIAMVAVLTVLAMIIDRRAMIAASLISLGSSFYVLTKEFEKGLAIAASMLIVGVFVMVVALGWQPIRRYLVRRIVPVSLRHFIPPVKD